MITDLSANSHSDTENDDNEHNNGDGAPFTRRTGKKLVVLSSDNGTEYKNEVVRLKSHPIHR